MFPSIMNKHHDLNINNFFRRQQTYKFRNFHEIKTSNLLSRPFFLNRRQKMKTKIEQKIIFNPLVISIKFQFYCPCFGAINCLSYCTFTLIYCYWIFKKFNLAKKKRKKINLADREIITIKSRTKSIFLNLSLNSREKKTKLNSASCWLCSFSHIFDIRNFSIVY